MYNSYLVGNLRAFGGFGRLREKKECCRQHNKERDDDSLEISHGEEHQLLLVVLSIKFYKEKLVGRVQNWRKVRGCSLGEKIMDRYDRRRST